jgi:hypothetical protein
MNNYSEKYAPDGSSLDMNNRMFDKMRNMRT